MNKYNIYENLDSDDSNDAEKTTQNEKRKASKKLREIELLERKEKLTTAEIEKINMKSKWTNILYPIQDVKLPDEECKTKQQARHMEREKKREKEKEKQRKEDERREREAERREQERAKWEKIRREKEKEAKREKEKEAKREKEEIQKICKLEKEFRDELAKTGDGNVNRVFRILSLKYHPDRNINKETVEDSVEKQKILGNIREKYLLKQ